MKRFYLLLICLTVSLLATTQTFSQGIIFRQDDWQNVLMQAKAQKKLIFVDIYTTWCGPCKEMDKKTFTESSVGDKFNARFINYKVDAEKGFGINLAKRYNVTSYPTCLFVDATENLMYKQEGLLRAPDLLKEADMVLNNQANAKPRWALEKLYNEGRRDSEFLSEFISVNSLYTIDNTNLVEEYVKSLTPIQYSSDKTLRIIVNNGFKIDGKAFDLLLKFREKAESLFEGGVEKVNRAFSQSINEVFDVALKTKNQVMFDKALAANLKALPNTADRVNDKNKLAFYLAMKDVNKFSEAAEQYLDQYVMFVQVESIRKQDLWEYEKIMQNYKLGIRDSVGAGAALYQNLKKNAKYTMARLTANELNEVVKAFYDQVDDKVKLKKAIEWAKRSLELVETPDSYHSYAQLMLKLGDKQMALDIEQKAYDVALREKLDTQKFTAALEKMR
ncbi:thioredoxin domain-containing protein [Arcicella sp. LKC2W]|uniref:thioredoxin family protein n=1 Tax=Arcicella sp. LKC2W TaxID=2984198 RepID=UPI002B216310|nr:thioredoxin domain-containing protein [Arcicella sp. LKC2W]MEA5461338.1 thioredoxin domain-containing protein [Arcicella sp. LKC2W]